MKNLFFVLLMPLMFLSFMNFANAWHGGGGNWNFVEEVHFYHDKTSQAIRNCKRAQDYDSRCTRRRRFICHPCSEIPHSDHSSYEVWSRGWSDTGGRELVRTYDFYHRKTAEARKKCERARSRNRTCSRRRYECSPCTRESHTDHSEYSLYRLTRL